MRPLLIFLLSIFSLIAYGEDLLAFKAVKPRIAEEESSSIIQEDRIFQVVEQMPEFPGGDEAMMKFIKEHLVYPDSALRYNIQGRVVLGFMVNEDGSISDIQIKKSLGKYCDQEAIMVVKLFPKFKPGKQQGKAVKVAYVLPIMFKLPSSDLPGDKAQKIYDPRKREHN